MNQYNPDDVEEWARQQATDAGVEYVPLIQSEPLVTAVTVRFIFDRLNKFEASQVTVRLVMQGYKVLSYLHAEQWFTVEVSVPNEAFPAVYVRAEEAEGPELNAQQQAAQVWNALEAKGVKVSKVDGASVDIREELEKILRQSETEARARRAKLAREARERDGEQ
ncbi:hypothetical protein [Streptomyces californicus]|uniref:hypothetical protein n=1 Tax=Streptomyces californicus TaxID=67351 RepID=UPI0036817DD4